MFVGFVSKTLNLDPKTCHRSSDPQVAAIMYPPNHAAGAFNTPGTVSFIYIFIYILARAYNLKKKTYVKVGFGI